MNAATQPRTVAQLVAEYLEEERPSVEELVSEMNAGRAPDAPPDAAMVLARHPELATNRAVVRELAYEEYCQRVDAGEQVDPVVFLARFPACKTALRDLISCHEVLEQNLVLLDNRDDPAAWTWPAPGQTLLGFTLLRQLGRGKVARVFLARESALGNRLVALKVSCLETAEAETLGRLRHPNIVLVHSVKVDPVSGLTVVCMEYHGRATLADVLDHAFPGPTPPPPRRADVILEAVRNAALPEEPQEGAGGPWPGMAPRGTTYVDGILDLALPLAEALAYVHAQKIFHRDLKPSNVLVSPDGRPLLLDFNLSFDPRAEVGHLGGTLSYMSPEQLLATDPQRRGDGSLLDARSDLFSLGVILFELLTGRHPFGPVPWPLPDEEQRGFLVARQRQPPNPLRQANPRVDRPLARLIARCLAYNPNDRPASAEELACGLRAAQARRRVRRWLAAHVGVLVGTALLLAALVAGAAYAWSARDRGDAHAFQRGRQAYQQGRWAEAVEHFNRAYDVDAARPDVLFARGRARQQLGQFSAAVADYTAALELPGDNERKDRLKACLSYCYGQLDNHQEAICLYDQLERAKWKTAGMLNNCGWSSMQLQGAQRDSALAYFTRAIELDSKLLAAYYNRAKYHVAKALQDRTYSWEPGIADIQRAIQLEPDSAWLHYEAAFHYSVALRNTREESFRESALNSVKKALYLGLGADQLRKDRLLMDNLKGDQRFWNLLNARPSMNSLPLPSPHLVDPLRGLDN